jgi:hypothetical protein
MIQTTKGGLASVITAIDNAIATLEGAKFRTELKHNLLYAVDIDGVQWDAFRYKKDALAYAKKMGGVIVKRKLLTYQY